MSNLVGFDGKCLGYCVNLADIYPVLLNNCEGAYVCVVWWKRDCNKLGNCHFAFSILIEFNLPTCIDKQEKQEKVVKECHGWVIQVSSSL